MAQNKVPPEFSEYLRKLGRKGAKRRMEILTPEERTAIAKKAAAKSAEVRSKKAAAKKKAGGE